MVFAVNCGQTGSANSFDNFKQAALAVGAALNAGSTTAAYGGVTIPAAPAATLVTQAVSLSTSGWTTTYSSYPGSPAPTPASLQGNVITVKVGANGTTFDPPHVSASPRDTISFQLYVASPLGLITCDNNMLVSRRITP